MYVKSFRGIEMWAFLFWKYNTCRKHCH